MPTAIQSKASTKAPTSAQRVATAVEIAAANLGLDDLKRLQAALAEIAGEELSRNAAFAERVKERYLALAPVRAPRPTPRTKLHDGGLKPQVSKRRTVGETVDVVAPIDPRTLVPLYGNRLADRLAEYSPRALWEMAKVLAPEVGEKAPTLKSGAPTLTAYILRHVSGTQD